MMEKNIDQLIARILSKEASSEEVVQFSNWLNADEKKQEEFSRIRSYWQAEVSSEEIVNPLISSERFALRLKKEQRKKQNRMIWSLTSVAAIFLFLIGFSTWHFVYNMQPEKAIHYYTYMTENNRSEVVLSDGTKVVLNKESQLIYTNLYGEGKRDVQLIGEAYFEVAHDSLTPFILTMGESSIHVLGTKFNASSYENAPSISATLLEGSIRFESSGQQVVLLPDQQINFNKDTKRIDVIEVDSRDIVSWTKNVVKFKKISFAELVGNIEKAYQSEIIIGNKDLLNPELTVSASFDENQSLEEVLTVISRSVPIKWSKKENSYYIK